MTASIPLWLASGLYCWQAFEYFRLGQHGMTLAFLAYALANGGFIWSIYQTGVSHG